MAFIAEKLMSSLWGCNPSKALIRKIGFQLGVQLDGSANFNMAMLVNVIDAEKAKADAYDGRPRSGDFDWCDYPNGYSK